MILAMAESGELVHARRDVRAFCPVCREPVIPKIGTIVSPHWAHKTLKDCDSWAEPETEWHLQWKKVFSDAGCEIEKPFRTPLGCHRADVYIPEEPRFGRFGGYVVEIQHSPIDVRDVQARCGFYRQVCKGLLWIVDAVNTGSWGWSFGYEYWETPRCRKSWSAMFRFSDGLFLQIESTRLFQVTSIGSVKTNWCFGKSIVCKPEEFIGDALGLNRKRLVTPGVYDAEISHVGFDNRVGFVIQSGFWKNRYISGVANEDVSTDLRGRKARIVVGQNFFGKPTLVSAEVIK